MRLQEWITRSSDRQVLPSAFGRRQPYLMIDGDGQVGRCLADLDRDRSGVRDAALADGPPSETVGTRFTLGRRIRDEHPVFEEAALFRCGDDLKAVEIAVSQRRQVHLDGGAV